MDGFIPELVEHRTDNTEVVGLTPAEASCFYRLILQLLKLFHNHDDHIFRSYKLQCTSTITIGIKVSMCHADIKWEMSSNENK